MKQVVMLFITILFTTAIFASKSIEASNVMETKKVIIVDVNRNAKLPFTLCFYSHPIFTTCCPMNDGDTPPIIITAYSVTITDCATGIPLATGFAQTGNTCPAGSFHGDL